MSMLSTNEEVVVSLQKPQDDNAAQSTLRLVSKVTFAWDIHVTVQPLPSNLWRVQMIIEAEGSYRRSFLSNPVDVAFNTVSAVTFPSAADPSAPDDFWAERLESGPYSRTAESGNTVDRGGVPTVHFRLLPDATGTKAERLVIEQTSMAIFWIIGARNIVLIEVDNL